MAEMGVAAMAPETFAARLLPVYTAALAEENFWEAEVAARVRTVGEHWARSGGTLDALLDAVSTVASRLIDSTLSDHIDLQKRCSVLRRFGDACGRVAIELVWGFNRSVVRVDGADAAQQSPHDLAVALLTGRTADAVWSGKQVLPAYAVVALRVSGASAAETEDAFLRCGGPDTMTLLHGENGCVLLPVPSEEEAVRVCTRVAAALRPHDMWAAVTWVETAGVPEGRQVASDVLSLVTTLHLPSNVYRRRDVLVEYAAVRSPAVASRLRRLIEPVMVTPVLRETLEALVAEDGNRTRAAERLIIHRSTIDYRLQRIERLTGQCPASLPGMRTLTAAYALHSLDEENRGVDAAPVSKLPQGP